MIQQFLIVIHASKIKLHFNFNANVKTHTLKIIIILLVLNKIAFLAQTVQRQIQVLLNVYNVLIINMILSHKNVLALHKHKVYLKKQNLDCLFNKNIVFSVIKIVNL